MRLLVIGCNGFIGSHCVSYFTAKGWEVTAAGFRPPTAKTTFVQLDGSAQSIADLFNRSTFDICINASGAASVPSSFQDPNTDYLCNAHHVQVLLEAIRRSQSGCFLLNFSSAAVYGNPQYLPVTIDHLTKPLSPYGFHKRQAEYICEEYGRFFGIETCNLRIFSAFGPGLKKQLFWDLWQRIGQENWELYGTGYETRDFIFIEDLLQAINLILLQRAAVPQIINVANGLATTIQFATQLLCNAAGVKNKFFFGGQERNGDPLFWQADISPLTSLGYKQRFSLEQGVKRYIKWAAKQAS